MRLPKAGGLCASKSGFRASIEMVNPGRFRVRRELLVQAEDESSPHGCDGIWNVTPGSDRRSREVGDDWEGEPSGRFGASRSRGGKRPAKGDQESVGGDAEARMVMKASPSSPLEVAEFPSSCLVIAQAPSGHGHK